VLLISCAPPLREAGLAGHGGSHNIQVKLHAINSNL
jgi:hypothetical protein